LEASANEVILPGETLIILDEIQSCERALTSLKYFAENAPEYHVAAAWSLLGVALSRESRHFNRKKYSFPVGKVESMTLYPLDFEEYLWSLGEERLADEIRSCYAALFDTTTPTVGGNCQPGLPGSLHQRAIEHYRCYLIIGGMPACVAAFANHGKTVLIQAGIVLKCRKIEQDTRCSTGRASILPRLILLCRGKPR
jgi:hypothetical protein